METAKHEVAKLDGASLGIAAEKRQELLNLFPEIRTEGNQIDFERLKLVLGEAIEGGRERFGLTWPGKAQCFRTIQAPSMATLLPCPDKSVDFDTTQNVIIEGDNLEVLKLLQKAYLGKVKMIYIDPPYNTGNDFIYPDDYSESLQTYLQYTGQSDPDGKRFGTNSDTDGRFHSKWLNMIYPRLYLARNLLRSDGVMFISSGQTELANLIAVCNEIFGEVNRIAICTRLQKTGGQKGKFFSPNTDYVVVYAKDVEDVPDFRDALSENLIRKVYTQIEVGGTRDGQRYRVMGLFQPTLDERANQRYYISCPDGELVIPPGNTMPDEQTDGVAVKPAKGDGVWRWTFKRFDEERRMGNVLFKQTTTSPLITANGKQSKWNIYTKIWLNDRIEDGAVPLDIFDKFENRHSSQELSYLGIPYDFAKPTDLICYLAGICGTQDGDTVLDFFAGSGTTGHAVLKLNEQDGANRKFILIQLPEPTGRDDFPTITDICEERVRRVISNLNESDKTKLQFGTIANKDRGFRVFNLAQSNIKEWDGTIQRDPQVLAEQLRLKVDHLRDDRSDLDIVYEVLIKSGYPASSHVSEVLIEGRRVYSVSNGAFLICLDRNLTLELLRAIAVCKPERVLLLDEGFAGNDQLKANAVQTFTAKNIVLRTL